MITVYISRTMNYNKKVNFLHKNNAMYRNKFLPLRRETLNNLHCSTLVHEP